MPEYHRKESCNKCGGQNIINVVDTDNGYTSECETTCIDCGHNDYWAFGYFESGTEIESKCKKYIVGEK